MKKLETIKIQNFKIFNEEVTIPVEGKHILAWGVNGSGKSSLYWALYTFLQCSSKPKEEAKKYFDKGDESLHNIHAAVDLKSFIQLGFKETGSEVKFHKLGADDNDTHSDSIPSINAGSEFITHRLLLNFYNYRHSQKIDLFPVFYRDIFPYFNTPKGNSFSSILTNIEKKLNTETPKNIEAWVKEFNDGIEDLIQSIRRGDASKYYNDHFAYNGEKIDIQIHFQEVLEVTGRRGSREIKEPVIRLQAKLQPDGNPESEIKRPQSFFNEARINAIALSIRFVLMKNRPEVDTVKLLVLDDLLISLDMQNRVKIIKLILKLYKEEYQLMVFTHDKGFYKEMLRQIEPDKESWQVMQFYEPESTGSNPKIEYEDDTYIAKADSAFLRRDYEACALYLRKETESILVKFLDPNMEVFWKRKDWRDLSEFIKSAKKKFFTAELSKFQKIIEKDISIENLEKLRGQIEVDPELAGDMPNLGPLLTYKKEVFNYIINKKKNISVGNNVYELLEEIDKIKDRVLNPAAHAGEAPFFESEIKDAIDKVKELKIKLDELTPTE
jgi:AAA15 family ATPase/GTPase